MSFKISQLKLIKIFDVIIKRRLGYFSFFFGFVCVVSLGLIWYATLAKQSTFATLQKLDINLKAGEYIFNSSGCSGCHMSEDGTERSILSGGREFKTAYGHFYAPNISMSVEYGIGAWSLKDFANALRLGISPDNEHYYPSFPYTSYNRITDQDLADLWAFWQTLPSNETKNKEHDLFFPYSLRGTLGIWKKLFLNKDWVGGTTEVRGRYLVEALGHCAECHTPRNSLGGFKLSSWMQGGANPSGVGTIPNIQDLSDRWSAEEMEEYLLTGFTPDFDVVGGHMADVIENTKLLSYDDRISIYYYLKSLKND